MLNNIFVFVKNVDGSKESGDEKGGKKELDSSKVKRILIVNLFLWKYLNKTLTKHQMISY